MENETIEKTEVQEVSVIETTLSEQNITKQIIAKLKSDYSGLKINGIDDNEGFKKVEDARKHVKQVRVLASKICKEGRELAIKIQKDWIAAGKQVVAELEAIETPLENESNRIKQEEKRILFEAAQQSKLPYRIEKLMTIGTEVEDSELLKINDEQFASLFNDLHEKHLSEKSEALRAEQAKLDKIKREEAEREAQRLEEEKRQKDLKDAAEKARIEAEAKLKAEMERNEREAKEAVERAVKAKEAVEQASILAASKAEAEKQAALIKAEEDKKSAIAELERKQKEKEAAELKAKQEAEAKAEADKQTAIEAELSKGDLDKMADLITSLTALKTKYTFKSAKYKKLQTSINVLIDKIIEYSINK